jgi:broad specificity phosphatase PhoE
MTARLGFISHTATEAQRQAAFPLDEPIHEREQARIAVSDRSLPKVEQVWSAPERRAQQTSRPLGLPTEPTYGLRDCDYGRWRSRKLEDIQSDDPEGLLTWLTDPSAAPHGGESIERLTRRVGSWVDG